MSKLFGNTSGLKANQIKRLERLYRRRIPFEYVVTPEAAREMTELSREIRRQVGLLINRQGKITHVIVGDNQEIMIPDTSSDYRPGPGRLRGLRCVHTHLKGEELSKDDLTDLALLRFDLMAAISVKENGLPGPVFIAHVMPGDGEPYQKLDPVRPNQLDIECLEIVRSIEEELSQKESQLKASNKEERALLVSVTTKSKYKDGESMAELEELAQSSSIDIAGTVIQYRKKVDSKFLLGRGKLNDIMIMALQKHATLIVFDQELNPSQTRSITDATEYKVIDRTQLILDIFSRRAKSSEGKLQVELAQLKYLLPRLMYKNTAMSRLTGGIGGRGPGETKLEIGRRRVRDRITKLEKSLKKVKQHRVRQKSQRNKKGLPMISIIGYTNAGKSTLLNTLTKSQVITGNRLFATLDPSSRRLRFPDEVEVIITDTVGFIRDLPKELVRAFSATLEELESADLLLHVVDISNPAFKQHVKSVETILADLGLDEIPVLFVLNKADMLTDEELSSIRIENQEPHNQIFISALKEETLAPLTSGMSGTLQRLMEDGFEITKEDV